MGHNIVVGSRLKSIEDLDRLGYVLLEDVEFPIKNNIRAILKERKMHASDLGSLIGVPRQTVSHIMRGNIKPGIDFALKVAVAFDLKVEDIFDLTKGAWVQSVSTQRETAYFLDMQNLEFVGGRDKNHRVKKNRYEYIDYKENKLLTKKEMTEAEKSYKERNKDKRIEEVRKENPTGDYNRNASVANELLEAELKERYGLLYKRIGKYAPKYEDLKERYEV